MGCHSLLQGIFPIQGLNPCPLYLLHWKTDTFLIVPPGKPPPQSLLHPYLPETQSTFLPLSELPGASVWGPIRGFLSFYHMRGSCLPFIVFFLIPSVQFSSVTQSCPNLCDPMDYSRPGPPSITSSQSSPKLMSIELVMPSNHLILCRLLLLLPSMFPSLRVFSNESKYWRFSSSISPSN